MSEHTPGRLVVRGGYSIYTADDKTPVADTCLTNSAPDNDEANARRLVSCWNALDGLSQDALDGGWNFKDSDAYTIRIEKERESLRAVNAELLAALGSIEEYWNQDQNESAMADACWHAIETARAAIASAADQAGTA